MSRSRCLRGTECVRVYRFEFVEGGAVFDLRVLVIGEEGGPEAADDRLGVSVLHGECCHLHA
jgi:hypothetical protein